MFDSIDPSKQPSEPMDFHVTEEFEKSNTMVKCLSYLSANFGIECIACYSWFPIRKSLSEH